MIRAYLFSFGSWQYSQLEYILIYAENEELGRIEATKHLSFNNGRKPKPEDLKLCTYGKITLKEE